ncbi:MAG: hypothetical protein ABIP48_19405, partial [Planctomycetota bacterium]
MAVSALFLVVLVAIGVAIFLGTVVLASIFFSERGRTFLKVLLIVPMFVLVIVALTLFVRFQREGTAQYPRAEAVQAREMSEAARAAQEDMEIRLEDAHKHGEDARKRGEEIRKAARE